MTDVETQGWNPTAPQMTNLFKVASADGDCRLESCSWDLVGASHRIHHLHAKLRANPTWSLVKRRRYQWRYPILPYIPLQTILADSV